VPVPHDVQAKVPVFLSQLEKYFPEPQFEHALHDMALVL
jgi:hypothetical protein